MRPHDKERVVQMLGEVKYAEKKVQKLQDKLPVLESRIRQALTVGNRDAAKQYALQFEELKLEVAQAEQAVVAAKRQLAVGKERSAELASAEAAARIVRPLGAMADSLDVLSRDDDMLQKLEQDAAVTDARLDIAMDAAREKDPTLGFEDPSTAEDILKEFEGGP